MSEFDKVIGYQDIKEELIKICDMIKNPEKYEKLGAKLPRGVIFYGNPGLGKTLMAQCFIKESNLTAFTIRRNRTSAELIKYISDTFEKAKASEPSIVFLDDLDKFGNDDFRQTDACEYVAVQAAIDEIKNHKVFVIATANNYNKLPDSLIRAGRFDISINFNEPTEEDSLEIIKYYLKDKNVSADINIDDISKMISYESCADLESVLNEAAILAGFNGQDSINTDDIVKSVLKTEYGVSNNFNNVNVSEKEKIAIHEAGHTVMSEILVPGSIGFASIKSNNRNRHNGLVHRCKELGRRPYEILVLLSGKAATEMYYSNSIASGCQTDLSRASDLIRDGICDSGTVGLSEIDVSNRHYCTSEAALRNQENMVHAELERHLLKAREILMNNREFLEKVKADLMEKEVLLNSDIQKIKECIDIVPISY